MTHCVIILPDLLTVPEEATVELSLPALEKLLGRGRATKTQDSCVEQTLMRHFGYKVPEANSLPAGKIRWAADFNQPAPQFCVCADPVHMLADIDHARLMDASALKLSKAESDHYINALNKVFCADGLEFVAGSPDRWYLTGLDASMLKTLPVKSLVGRNVASFLPEGDASAHWRTLTTEIQMVLFADSMNQTREDQGQLSLNSLWLWGGGHYEKPTGMPPANCYTDDALCQGLAKHGQTSLEKTSTFDCESIKDGDVLLMDGKGNNAIIYGNYVEWKEWIVNLEASLFVPVWRALQTRQINQLTLNVGNAREFSITPSRIPAFWRRRKKFKSYVSEKTVELN